MTEEQLAAIRSFFAAIDELKRLAVIRSDRYLGDIGEFICASDLKLKLARNARKRGHDGTIRGRKVQVKYHGGTSTTVACGDPSQYEQLVVVLGPSSVLRPEDETEPFLLYRIMSDSIKAKGSHRDGEYRYAKAQLQEHRVRLKVRACK